MATDSQRNSFVNQIAPLIQKYALEYGYKVASAIIAQACCESNYGLSSLAYKYHNYFGMKCGSGWTGASINMRTNEEYTKGTLTSIRDNFRVYTSMEEGVKGYFQFIQYPRYANLKAATTPLQYLTYIKNDGFATSSSYVNTNMSIVRLMNLERFDNFAVMNTVTFKNMPYAAVVKASALRVRSSRSAADMGNIVQVGGHDLLLPRGMVIAIGRESSDGWAELQNLPNHWVSLSYLTKS